MSAQADAATSKPFDVDFDGHTYTIPASEDWDLDVLDYWEQGKVVAMLRALLGPEDWKEFRSKPRSVKHASDFFSEIQKAGGLGN